MTRYTLISVTLLLQASSKDAGQLAAALHHRILALRSRAEQETESIPEPPHAEITQSNEDDSDDDDELAKNNSGNSSNIAPTGNTTASGTHHLIYFSSVICFSLV